MSIGKIIKKIFVPDLAEDQSVVDVAKREHVDGLAPTEVTVNEVINAIKHHFGLTVKKLSTKYNYLYHTSFTIYLKASNYSEISESLPAWVGGAEQMLIDEIKSYLAKSNIKNYRPHSQFWQFQLVEIPDEAELDGVDKEAMSEGALIQISSTLFPPSDEPNESALSGSNRVVTTVQGVNSLRAIRNCINPDILSKLYLVETDRIKLSLVLDSVPSASGFAPAPPPPSPTVGGSSQRREKSAANKAQPQPAKNQPRPYLATIQAQDGEFLDGASNNKIHTVAMTADEVHIVGRSSMRGGPESRWCVPTATAYSHPTSRFAATHRQGNSKLRP